MSVQNRSPKKNIPTAAIVCAVALVACMGIGGALLLREDAPDGAQSSSSAMHRVIADNTEGDLQTAFIGAQDVSSAKPHETLRLMETENGWYHIRHVATETRQLQRIYYCDKATGEDVVLCARPECTHNNEYCIASNSKYVGAPSVYYENYLYGIAYNTDKMQDTNPFAAAENEDIAGDVQNMLGDTSRLLFGEITLVRYAPDGTELTGLCSLENVLPTTLDGCSFSDVSIIGHRGALWIGIVFQRAVYESIVVEGLLNFETAGAFALLHYDIKSGRLTNVVSMDLTENCTPSAPTDLCAAGDYVYFRKRNAHWADPLNGDRLYRVNIRTGAVEDVLHDVYDYAVCEDKLLFSTLKWINGGTAKYQLKVYDLAAGEASFFRGEEEYATRVQCTADYVFIGEDTPQHQISVYDWNGNLLQTIEQPFAEELKDPETDDFTRYVLTLKSLTVNGDRLYAELNNESIYMTDLSKAMETGIVDWQCPYDGILVIE